MESFLDTEIARLVYGYLVEDNCPEAAHVFLESSQHLKECHSVVKRGRRFMTKKCGRNLTEILDILADVTCLVTNFVQNCDNDYKGLVESVRTVLVLEDNVSTPRRTRVEKQPPPIELDKDVSNPGDDVLPDKLPEIGIVPQENQDNQEPIDIEYDIENRPALQVLLGKKEWHERLAENINKAVVSSDTSTDPEKLALEKVHEKKTLETIVNTFEADPIFEEILNELTGSLSVRNNEDTEQEAEENPSMDEEGPGVDEKLGEVKMPVVSEAEKEIIPDLVDKSPIICQASQPVLTSTPPPPPPPVNSTPLKSPLIRLRPSSPSVLKSSPILISTSGNLRPGAVSFRTSSPTTQLLSVITSSTSTLPKHVTNSTSPIPCAVISSFTSPYGLVAPKVFFKKDPNCALPPHSRIHIKDDPPKANLMMQRPPEQSKEKNENQPPSGDRLNAISEPSTNGPSEPVVMKRSGVRTRGGKRGGGNPPNRLKAIVPTLPKIDTIQLVVLSEDTIAKPAEVSVQSDQSANPVEEAIQVLDLSQSKESPDKGNIEATPVQPKNSTVILRKRLSLSSPRRGSHVRTLEFKTPPKGPNQRKANTSPKSSTSRGPLKPLKKIKRSFLFKSPSKVEQKPELPKKLKAWDEDLRSYTENVDIPTSVGLQRKKPVKKTKNPLDNINEESVIESPKSIDSDVKLDSSNVCVTPTSQTPCKISPESVLSSCSKSPGTLLESTLIKECVRIESLKKQLLSEKDLIGKLNKDEDIFQTPAKSVMQKGAKALVPMTPITRIREEIKELGKTKLITPTLPPTPKNADLSEVEVSPPNQVKEVKEPSPKPLKKKPKTPKKKAPRKILKINSDSSSKPVEKRAKIKPKPKKHFDKEKTIEKCIEQVKNTLYGNNKTPKTVNTVDVETVENKIEQRNEVNPSPTQKTPQITQNVQKCSKEQNFEDLCYNFTVVDDSNGQFVSKELKISPFINVFELSPSSGKKVQKDVVKTPESLKHYARADVEAEKRRRDRSPSFSDEDTRSRKKSRVSFKKELIETRQEEYNRPHFRAKNYRRESRNREAQRRSRYSRPSLENRRNVRNDYRRQSSTPNKANADRHRESTNSPRWERNELQHSETLYKEERKKNTRNDKEMPKHKGKTLQDIINENIMLSKKLQEFQENERSKKPSKGKKEESRREEGELSDTSCSESPKQKKQTNIFSRQKSGQRQSPSVADDSRTSLLKELDVDSFLSIVHGNNGNKPL